MQRVASSAIGLELRQLETEAHLLRCATVKQAQDYHALRESLEATKEVARSTSMAARKVFDDHAADVRLLLAELKHASPAAAAAVEKKLSASQTKLTERRRHAQVRGTDESMGVDTAATEHMLNRPFAGLPFFAT